MSLKPSLEEELSESPEDHYSEELVNTPCESNVIPLELSQEARRWMEAITKLREPCDRKTYGHRKREIAEQFGVSLKTIERKVKDWEEKGIAAFAETERVDKGKTRVSDYWQEFVLNQYKQGIKDGKRRTRRQVANQVETRDDELFEKELKQRRPGLIESWARLPYKERKEARHQEKLRLIDSGEIDHFEYRKDCGTPPTERTVYRMLDPIIQEKERKSNIRNVGWHGDKLVHKTRDGEELDVKYSNQVWQEDHTSLDIMLIDEFDQPLDRPWLTKITDSYSRCIMGTHLGFDSPSSQVTALALRHAILPKQYGPEYKLLEEWGTYGLPENLFTDGGSDFKSEHLKDIAFHLDFSLHLRDRPSEGGIEERSFGTINTDFLSGFYGYLGSNIQERPEKAEERACSRLKEFHQLLVRYIVDNYNQRIDARMGDQSRIDRWELGLEGTIPRTFPERELDICLMRKTRRSVYRGGYLKFENILHRGEYLGGYEGKFVTLRYDPDDITTVWVYYREADKNEEAFLTRAHATGLEGEKLSLWEAKAASKRIRKAGRAVSNESVLAEVRDRATSIEKTKSKKSRKKSEQDRLYSPTEPVDPADTAAELPEPLSPDTSSKEKEQRRYKVWDYDELLED